MMKPWYTIENADTIDTPQVVVYEERVLHNIREAIRMTGDVNRLRPHIKTNKTKEVVQLMLDEGIRKFKCATIEEATLLAGLQVPDVLLAYQPVGPKVQRLYDLKQAYPQTAFSCLVDHAVAAKALSDLFAAKGQVMDVFIDLNVGMNRTGIVPEQAAALAAQILALPGLHLRGLHAYDGHFRDPDIQQRKASCDAQFAEVVSLQNLLQEKYGMTLQVIAGGSPTFPVHAQRPGVECSPGTFVFWDKGYSDICPEQHFLPAALVLSRVISLPSPGRVCVDMGHKSIAAENDVAKRAWFINEPDAVLLGQSEEHGLVLSGAEHLPGDLMYVMPYHVCPTINLYSSVVVVRDGKAMEHWTVAAKH